MSWVPPPPAGFGPPPPPPAGHPLDGPRTDATAVWAFALAALGFLTCGVTGLVGIILSFIASGRIKESGGRLTGRGWVTGARIAGVLSLLMGAALTVFVVVLGSLGERDSAASPAPQPVTTTSTPAPTTTTVPPTTVAPEDEGDGPTPRSLDKVVEEGPGTCFNTEDTPGARWRIVNCNRPHTDEYYAEGTVNEAATYPGEDAVTQQAEELCTAVFAAYVGIPYGESALGFRYTAPSRSSWSEGDRQVTCSLTGPNPGDTLIGSKRGSRE